MIDADRIKSLNELRMQELIFKGLDSPSTFFHPPERKPVTKEYVLADIKKITDALPDGEPHVLPYRSHASPHVRFVILRVRPTLKDLIVCWMRRIQRCVRYLWSTGTRQSLKE